jgi:hypothetical protein
MANGYSFWADMLHHLLFLCMKKINTPEGRVAVVTIEQGINNPTLLKEGDRETNVHQNGSTSQLPIVKQILRMAQESGYYHFEIATGFRHFFSGYDKETFHSLLSERVW